MSLFNIFKKAEKTAYAVENKSAGLSKDTLVSVSGTFRHIDGMAIFFEPNPDNVIKGGIDAPQAWDGGIKHYENAVRNLVIPGGIKSFASYFFMNWAVTELFTLPDSVEYTGDENDSVCVFSNCFLPEVRLPGSIKLLGNFAFGSSCIKKLVVDPAIKSKYLRQFKDSTIEELYLPGSIVNLRNSDEIYVFYSNFYVHCKCHIIEY